MATDGTYATISSIMGIVEGVLTPNSKTVLVLEIEMTILYEKLPRLFELQTQQLNLLGWVQT